MSNYYISDLHINHKNVLNCEGSSNFDNRPFKTFEEMNEVLLNNINFVCKCSDDLYLLGDSAWKVDDDTIAWFSKIKPNIHAIKGNHCQFKDSRYKRLFCEICDYKEVSDNIKGRNYNVVLSHYPIMFWKKMRRFNNDGNVNKHFFIHLYGHLHNSQEEKLYQQFLKYVNDNYHYGALAFNVGCMHWNYTPVTLEQILAANNIDLYPNKTTDKIIDNKE